MIFRFLISFLLTPLLCLSQNMLQFDYPTIKVKGGVFMMGCDLDRDANREGKCYDDETLHKVYLKTFHLGKYEVTQAQWKSIMGNNPSHFQTKNGYSDCPDCPVEQVSWQELQQFILSLNQKTGKKFRLPTEAEWEYAARGGKKSKGYKYAGDKQLNNVSWWLGNSSKRTHPVGKKMPNELGFYDMSGNVWEWCLDAFAPYDLSQRKNPLNRGDKKSLHVLRGGSWNSDESNCRSSNRDNYYPLNHYNYQTGPGFRLVLEK